MITELSIFVHRFLSMEELVLWSLTQLAIHSVRSTITGLFK